MEAFKWYKRSADQGHATAMAKLGLMFAEGEGVTKDYQEAMNWFTIAAQQEDPMGEFNIGVMYENGWGLERDLEEAARWYRRVLENNTARENQKAQARAALRAIGK